MSLDPFDLLSDGSSFEVRSLVGDEGRSNSVGVFARETLLLSAGIYATSKEVDMSALTFFEV